MDIFSPLMTTSMMEGGCPCNTAGSAFQMPGLPSVQAFFSDSDDSDEDDEVEDLEISGAVLETINDTAETRRLTRCLWSSLDPDMLIDDVSLGPFEEVKRWYSPRAYSIANRVFGFDCWNTAIVQVQTLFLKKEPLTRIWSTEVEVTLNFELTDKEFVIEGHGVFDEVRDNKLEAVRRAKKAAIDQAFKDALAKALWHFEINWEWVGSLRY
eukprot:TRINITY_DN27687_c0_g1_i1.p1 TRINITY_DN27687_c0_g1~~TRINITY_DN27687_c0_g1_i1.p1  ORF type:complete len:211 (+),score=25.36 TRINITY_DN27687_c0_g1_i1:54-686(+)